MKLIVLHSHIFFDEYPASMLLSSAWSGRVYPNAFVDQYDIL